VPRLAEEIEALLAFEPRPAALQLDGAAASAQHLHALCASAAREAACATV
jgi:predicted glycosyltransferase